MKDTVINNIISENWNEHTNTLLGNMQSCKIHFDVCWYQFVYQCVFVRAKLINLLLYIYYIYMKDYLKNCRWQRLLRKICWKQKSLTDETKINLLYFSQIFSCHEIIARRHESWKYSHSFNWHKLCVIITHKEKTKFFIKMNWHVKLTVHSM